MARKLVYFCVFILTATLLWAMVMKALYPTIDTSDVLTYTGAAFGGELLLLAFKRVFAKSTDTESGGTDSAAG